MIKPVKSSKLKLYSSGGEETLLVMVPEIGGGVYSENV